MAKPRYKSDRKIPRKGAPPPGGTNSSTNKRGKRPFSGASGERKEAQKHVASETAPQTGKPQPAPFPPRVKPQGERLPEKTGCVLEAMPNADYALIDSGNGEKLERYGNLTIRRPEGQALWLPNLDKTKWDNADAIFTGDTDEEGQGRWLYPNGDLPETWPLAFDGLPYFGRFTSFRHTGVFPEQATHWHSLQTVIKNARRANPNRPVRMLNLFGYTGLASLVAARAGAEVTHVDASKKAIVWARENQELAKLDNKPIRWICDDAMKFCQREVRRESTYDVILLDPPAYGRGPKGEVWQLFEALPHMLDLVAGMQSNRPLMTVLTAYAIRASHFAIHELMQEVFAGRDGRLESGELILRHEVGERALSTSMFSRFIAREAQL